MHCTFQTKDSLCTGKYAGYACIMKQCTYYKESRRCEHHEETGDYCRKYARFGCVGKGNCGTLTEYLESVAAEAQG